MVIDEAAGVSPDIFTEVSGLLTSSNAHLLLIGNPTSAIGEFADSFKTAGYHAIKVSAFDTPNFTAFGITEQDLETGTWQEKITGPLPYPELITPEWAAERLRKWGKDNPLFQARVLGEFPSTGSDTLIPLAWIERAREAVDVQPDNTGGIMAVDVARYGADNSVIVLRRGGHFKTVNRFNGADTMSTAGFVKRAYDEYKPRVIMVDVIGVGAGVYDRLYELGLPVREFNSSNSAHKPDEFANRRAECYWSLRTALEAGPVSLAECHEDIVGQLAGLRWKADSQGRVLLESKDDLRRRGQPSPDDADAVSMCYGIDLDVTCGIVTGGRRVTAGFFQDDRSWDWGYHELIGEPRPHRRGRRLIW